MGNEAAKNASEQERKDFLLDAQNKASALFDEIQRDLIRPGKTEKEMSDDIHKLGQERHGIKTHWHKRVVRSGPHTLMPYAESPPDRKIEEDDILFVDLGPVFEAWEADFGRTFVIGNDEHKIRLRDALKPTWEKVYAEYHKKPDMSGEELYSIACQAAKDAGYEFGNIHAGHLVGDFPHERIPQDKISLYITKGSTDTMAKPGKDGKMRHWILEMHMVDRERQIGGFMEQLLTV